MALLSVKEEVFPSRLCSGTAGRQRPKDGDICQVPTCCHYFLRSGAPVHVVEAGQVVRLGEHAFGGRHAFLGHLPRRERYSYTFLMGRLLPSSSVSKASASRRSRDVTTTSAPRCLPL